MSEFQGKCDAIFGIGTINRILETDLTKIVQVAKIDTAVYRSFLTYFEKLETINRDSMLIAMNFTYGWMPTMLKLGKSQIYECTEDLLNTLNKAKSGALIDSRELKLLKENFNNSMVGSSKLLHFINPETYPILDSKVLDYLTGSLPSMKHYINRIDLYERYIDFCEKVISNPNFAQLKSELCEHLGINASNMRAVELVMYLKQSTILKQSSKKA